MRGLLPWVVAIYLRGRGFQKVLWKVPCRCQHLRLQRNQFPLHPWTCEHAQLVQAHVTMLMPHRKAVLAVRSAQSRADMWVSA